MDPILSYVATFVAEHGYSPTVREIAAGCEIRSTSTVHLRLAALVDSGQLVLEPGRCRTIRVPT